MEIKGEEFYKKNLKTSRWIFIGYVICIVVFILACLLMDKKENQQMPEAIDFTTNGAIGMEQDVYAYLEVQGVTKEVAIYGDQENKDSAENDRYCIALNQGYWYVVDLNFETIDLLKEIQEYTYSTDEDAVAPDPVKIYGMTQEIPTELKQLLVDFYNDGIEEEEKIGLEDFEENFGSVMLNVRKSPINTNTEEMLIVFSLLGIFFIFMLHIYSIIIKGKTKKYIKVNNYEEELVNQLENNIEEKHYKDKVILTKDFLVDLKNTGVVIFKYSDIKWVHIHNVKYYGTITVSSSIVVHLKDGKNNMQCVEIKGDSTEEFLGIFDKICEKAPVDCLKGFTKENQQAFKQYKKDLKKNLI